MKKAVQNASLILAALAALSQAVYGQNSAKGTLTGVVTDSEGAVIEGTLVRILHWGQDDKPRAVESGMALHTDASGQFKVELAPGIYDLFLSAPGFSPAAKQVKIDARKKTVVNSKLNVSRFLEGMRVTAP
jgi:hypothetical protein